MADAESLRRWWWPGSTIGKPRRGMVDRRTATLMYAGRNRRSATPRKVPQAKRAPARWWPSQSTHGIGPAATAPRRSLRLAVTVAPISAVTVGQQASLGRHLRPQEPGELPGDRGGDHVLGVLAGGQPPEAPTQPQLRRPGTGEDCRVQALVAFAELEPDGGAVLQGPGRPRPAGRAGGRCHTW